MNWHDLVFSVGAVLFVIALIPALWAAAKPPIFTCMLTGTILAVFALNYILIGLTYSAATTTITSLLWFILATQQLRRRAGDNGLAD